jgi:hypothetical protein
MTATHAPQEWAAALNFPMRKGELAVTASTRTKGTARRIVVGPSSSDATSGSRALDAHTIEELLAEASLTETDSDVYANVIDRRSTGQPVELTYF